MGKYTGLALVGFCGIFLVMIILYAGSTYMLTQGENAANYGMDFLLPRFGGALAGLMICVLLVIKGVRIIVRSE